MNRQVAVLLLAAFAAGLAAQLDWRQDEGVLRDSLSRVHPRMRASWLKERGLDDSYYTTFKRPDSQGLREVGRWSYGPSYDVDGRVTPTETLVALARGSGVSLIRFSRADSLQLELLADINAPGLLNRVCVRDTLLYVGSAAGLEIWNIADERNPTRLSWIQTALNDFDVQDSFAYVIGADDSFKVYNVSDPANPVFRGACRDSGYCLSVTDTLALVAERWGLYVLGVGNPASPHRLNSWGSAIDGVTARGNLAYVTTFNPNQPGEIALTILDVSAPQNIVQLGHLNGPGGPEVYLIDTLAFCSGDAVSDTMKIVSVANPAQPRLIGTGRTRGWDEGIWASGSNKAAFLADNYEGLWAFDITNTANPVLDTVLPGVDLSYDVYINNGRAYIATDKSGLKILDVSDPTRPSTLGSYDTAGQAPLMRSAAAKDSFAFVGWGRPALVSVDVSDPTHPVVAGGCDDVTNPPEDIVIRDTFAYIAEASFFQIVNVARPREPVLVGSCLAGDLLRAGLVVQDTLAYFIGPFVGMQVFSIANPAGPYLVNTVAGIGAMGCDVLDTLLYVGDFDDSLHVWNFANARSPYQVSAVYATRCGYGVAVLGRYAYVGCDSRMRVFDVLDPRNPVEVGACVTPYEIRRVEAKSGRVYVCCYDAGVCVFDTFQAGIENRTSPSPCLPAPVVSSPVVGDVLALMLRAKPGAPVRAAVTDALGRVLSTTQPSVVPAGGMWRHRIDIASLPAGVYIINVRVGLETRLTRFVKLRRR
jgi:hypothetical protein